MRQAAATIMAWVFSIGSVCVGGCASSSILVGDPDPLAAAPVDFTLGVTVLNNPAPAAAAFTPVSHRTSRYVVMPDGALHAGDDPTGQRGADWLPLLTRTLNRAQLAHVWTLLNQLGFADASTAQPAINFQLVRAQPGEVIYLIGAQGDDQRWAHVVRVPADATPPAACTTLVSELARLGWMSDQPIDSRSIAPVRYDFGPDPYARYRNPN